MNKKIVAAVVCAFLLSSCASDSGEERESYIAVYQEFTVTAEVSETESETTVPISFSPLTADDEHSYLSDVLIIGDGECGKAVSCGLLTEDNVISVSMISCLLRLTAKL